MLSVRETTVSARSRTAATAARAAPIADGLAVATVPVGLGRAVELRERPLDAMGASHGVERSAAVPPHQLLLLQADTFGYGLVVDDIRQFQELCARMREAGARGAARFASDCAKIDALHPHGRRPLAPAAAYQRAQRESMLVSRETVLSDEERTGMNVVGAVARLAVINRWRRRPRGADAPAAGGSGLVSASAPRAEQDVRVERAKEDDAASSPSEGPVPPIFANLVPELMGAYWLPSMAQRPTEQVCIRSRGRAAPPSPLPRSGSPR
jgi:hypothetical protein